MATSYPFASFGTFKFKRSEFAIMGSDRGWVLTPTLARSRPLGSTADDIVTLAVGSMNRDYECNMEFDRFNSLRALINTTGVFTDFDRPSPVQQQAFLLNVEPLDRTVSSQKCDTVSGSHQRIRCKVTLVSQ
jgi:hypothetical protein